MVIILYYIETKHLFYFLLLSLITLKDSRMPVSMASFFLGKNQGPKIIFRNSKSPCYFKPITILLLCWKVKWSKMFQANFNSFFCLSKYLSVWEIFILLNFFFFLKFYCAIDFCHQVNAAYCGFPSSYCFETLELQSFNFDTWNTTRSQY